MKKNILLAASIILGTCGFSTYAQTEQTDTLEIGIDDTEFNFNQRTVVKPDSVVIVEDGEQFAIQIFGEEGNPDYQYSYQRDNNDNTNENISENGWDIDIPVVSDMMKTDKKPSRFSFDVGGLGFGFVDALDAPANMDVKMHSSYEIFIDHLVGIRYRPTRQTASFLVGFGFGWKNFRMTELNRFVKDGNTLGITAYPEGADPKFSRIKKFSLSIPVMFQQELGKDFSISAGAVVNFNTHASMKTKYILDGEERTYTDDNIHQRKVTVDIMGQINFKEVGLYVKYCPQDILDKTFGPAFNSISTGITLFY